MPQFFFILSRFRLELRGHMPCYPGLNWSSWKFQPVYIARLADQRFTKNLHIRCCYEAGKSAGIFYLARRNFVHFRSQTVSFYPGPIRAIPIALVRSDPGAAPWGWVAVPTNLFDLVFLITGLFEVRGMLGLVEWDRSVQWCSEDQEEGTAKKLLIISSIFFT